MRVVIRPPAAERLTCCVVCAGPFVPVQTLAALYDGPRPVGHVCPRCVADGPARASVRLQELAAKRRAVALRLGSLLPVSPRADLQAGLLDSADRLGAVAERLRAFAAWTVENVA